MERFAVVAYFGLLLLCACAVGPDFKRPEITVAGSWHATDPRLTTQTAADSLWWKSFNDPGAEQPRRARLPAEPVPADRRAAHRRGPRPVRHRHGPAVSADAGDLGERDGDRAAQSLATSWGSTDTCVSYQAGFDAAWELDFWGKYRRGVESEAAVLLASVNDYQAALVSLTAEVARTYVAIRTSEVLIRQAQDNARVQEEALGIAQVAVQERRHVGAGPDPGDRPAREHAGHDPAAAGHAAAATKRADHAARRSRWGPSSLCWPGRATIPKPPAQVAIGVPAEMLRRRPDIRSAEMTAAAQCARIGVAKADLYPSFSLLGPIGLRAFDKGPGTHNLFSTSSIFYSVGPSINWPFLNYGRLTNAVRVEDARFQESLVAYRDTVLQRGAGGRGRAGRFRERPASDGVRTERRDRGAARGRAGAGAVPGGRHRLPARAGCATFAAARAEQPGAADARPS